MKRRKNLKGMRTVWALSIAASVLLLFSAANSIAGKTINSLFTTADLPDYRKYEPENCSMCKAKKEIDAFANAFGYSLIQEQKREKKAAGGGSLFSGIRPFIF